MCGNKGAIILLIFFIFLFACTYKARPIYSSVVWTMECAAA
jgi:hypothetical protein